MNSVIDKKNNPGYVEIIINGETIPLKFGTMAMGKFCEMRKIKIHDAEKELSSGPSQYAALIDFIYCGACVGYALNKKEIDFTKLSVSEWLDSLTPQIHTQILGAIQASQNQTLNRAQRRQIQKEHRHLKN